mmetsp:Transcript_3450/g.4674  ORF Transcript_3450/g.4674 Transcript_3450/m.4674 type:complete len:91 (+) Transcript_3450:1191-1463(+)
MKARTENRSAAFKQHGWNVNQNRRCAASFQNRYLVSINKHRLTSSAIGEMKHGKYLSFHNITTITCNFRGNVDEQIITIFVFCVSCNISI